MLMECNNHKLDESLRSFLYVLMLVLSFLNYMGCKVPPYETSLTIVWSLVGVLSTFV